MKEIAFVCFIFAGTLSMANSLRKSPESMRNWAANQGWVSGANYVPEHAMNQIEMWQKETFDPMIIDREFSMAAGIGMTSMRVFLHDLLWEEDSEGFTERIEIFLQIASRHGIRPLFVLFDSCWNPHPKLGVQTGSIPGVHNSGWVQGPGITALLDPAQEERLENYVKGVVGHFAEDSRIFGWDVWNEPDGISMGQYSEPFEKLAAVEKLLPKVFEWARSTNPSQPLTSGVWHGNYSSDETLRPIEKIQLENSDIITFHTYDNAEHFETIVGWLQRYNRPIFCTEYLARNIGSTIQTILPVAHRLNVGVFNWGFVAGKSQTYLPWNSWEKPYLEMPAIWFHDLFHPSGKPFDEEEAAIFRKYSPPNLISKKSQQYSFRN